MLESKIAEILREVLSLRKQERSGGITPDSLLIDDLHLDSMEIAQLIAALEFELEVDPFSTKVAITSIRRVGDLYDAYEKCL